MSIWYEPLPESLQSHWFKKQIHTLYALGFVSEPSFLEPNTRLTRAQFADLVVKVLGLKQKGDDEKTFDDVDQTHPYYEPIQMLASHRILKGAGSRFMPNQTLTKLEALIGIFRAINPDFETQ